MERVPVLVAASGAPWEARALERLEASGPAVVLLKRCVDLPDLLASASTGEARAALVSPQLPGLDAESVAAVRRAGLGLLLVTAPADLRNGDRERLARIGVRHLLPAEELHLLPDSLRAAVSDSAVSDSAAPVGPELPSEPAACGRLVAVWGPTGGPGRTTVAVGLAAEIARRGTSAFLLDADPYGGAVGQHLGVLDEVSGLLAAARLANTGQLDADRLAGLARQVGPHLRVLTGLPRADRWAEVRDSAFGRVLDHAAGLAGHVVVDTGFSLEAGPGPGAGQAGRNTTTLAALERADEVLVVGAADPVGLSRLARALVDLVDLGRAAPGPVVRVVVNRSRSSLGWTEEEVRATIESFLVPAGVHFLPEDRAGADRALVAGRSLVESGDSGLRRGMARLADAVLGEPAIGRGRRWGRHQR